MESNKEEVKRAIELAKTYFEAAKYEKSTKLLNKALKMDPGNQEAKVMLENVSFAKNQSTTASKNGSKQSGSTNREVNGGNDGGTGFKKNYTAEQLRGVQRIRNSKSLYEVLNVDRSADEKQIKKQYRKLALKFHPDKNGAPGSDEAFKQINKAFSILSSKEKKRQYDLYGEENSRPGARSPFHGEEIDPEEIFRSFFGPDIFSQNGNVRMYSFGGFGMHQGVRRRGRHTQATAGRDETTNAFSLLQLLPIFLLLALSFMSLPEDSSSIFRLNRTPTFHAKRTTGLNLPGVYPDLEFYTKTSFIREYKHSDKLYEIEKQVTRNHLTQSEEMCQREKRQRSLQLKKLYNQPNKQTKINEIKQQKLKWCDKYTKIKAYL